LFGEKTLGERWNVAFSPERQQMPVVNNFNEQIGEFYQQALDCGQQAPAQNDPKVKRQFLELERLWLLLAQRCEFDKA
jgi:hypothetical protein